MNALSVRPLWVLLVDETGPVNSFIPGATWSGKPLEVLEQLVRALHPGLTVLSVEWAEKAQRIMGDDTLLVRIPGTHEVKAPKPKARRTRTVDVEPVELDAVDRGYWRSRELRSVMQAPARQLAPPSSDVVNTCSCGIAHTAASWAALPLCGAKAVREGNTLIHEDYRTCSNCGSDKVIRAGTCGVCTQCGTSQGCS